MSKIKEKFNSFSPQAKKKLVIAGLGVFVIIFGFVLNATKSQPKFTVKKDVAKKSIESTIEPKMLQQDIYQETKIRLDEEKKAREENEKKLEELRKKIEVPETDTKAKTFSPPGQPPIPSSSMSSEKQTAAIPPPPSTSNSTIPKSSGMFSMPEADQKAKAQGPKKIGGISKVSFTVSQEKGIDDKKKVNEKIYIPAGTFMEAQMLTGLFAATTEKGEKHPVPVLLKIQTLAQLPNSVKTDLKGCFLIATGFGDLASERAKLQLVTISCITKKGEAVIDQAVKGILVDNDAIAGIKGKVVAKMGSHMARMAISGLFGGVGDYLKQNTTVQSISPLGATQTFDKDKALQAGVGGGLSSAFDDLRKIYANLAGQTVPQIEVLPTKKVGALFQEGVYLELKERFKQ